MAEKKEAQSSRKLHVGFHNLHPNILGLDPVKEGRLRLSMWNGVDKLVLAALSDEILTYIDARIASLAPGGGSLADALNYNGSASIASTATSNLVSQSVTSWKLRGFYIYSRDGDGEVTLTYTVSSVVKTVKTSVQTVMRTGWFEFPNPIPIDDSTTVTLAVENTTPSGPLTYYGAVFGESV